MTKDIVYQFQGLRDFSCIQDQCENTCCGNWKIPVDDNTYDLWKKDLPDFHQIIATDNEAILPMNDDMQCNFLDNVGKCNIHANHGEKYLPKTCNDYPRYFEKVNSTEIQFVYGSCPEAARKMLLNENAFNLIEDNDKGAALFKDPIHSEDVTPKTIKEIYTLLTDYFLNENYSSEVLIFEFLNTIEKLDDIPMAKWIETINADTTLLNPESFNAKKVNSNFYSSALSFVSEIITQDFPFMGNQVEILDKGVKQTIKEIGSASKDKNIQQFDFQANHPDKAAVIQSWLRRHLALSLVNIGLPFHSQTQAGKSDGKKPTTWAKRIALDYIITRFSLHSLVLADSNSKLTDAIFIDLLHRIYRVLFHVHLKEQLLDFLSKDYQFVKNEVFCIR